MSRESLRRPAPVRDPPVLPGLRLEKHGRIVEPALGRVALVTGLVLVLSLHFPRSRKSWACLISTATFP